MKKNTSKAAMLSVLADLTYQKEHLINTIRKQKQSLNITKNAILSEKDVISKLKMSETSKAKPQNFKEDLVKTIIKPYFTYIVLMVLISVIGFGILMFSKNIVETVIGIMTVILPLAILKGYYTKYLNEQKTKLIKTTNKQKNGEKNLHLSKLAQLKVVFNQEKEKMDELNELSCSLDCKISAINKELEIFNLVSRQPNMVTFIPEQLVNNYTKYQ